MTTDLAGLGKLMELKAKSIEQKAPETVRQVARAIAPVLVYATPVDTSRARANWQGSVGSPKTSILFPYPATPPTSSDGAAYGIKSIEDATKAYKGQREGIFIVNNLDYIGKLNSGHSAQAPANFVELAVVQAIRSLKTVKLL